MFLYQLNLFTDDTGWNSRSQWQRGLRCRSAAARLLRSWVRIPRGAWIFVCCECCVLSGRGLCDEMITCPEESYRLWCVVVCDLENPQEWGGHDSRWVAAPQKKKTKTNRISVWWHNGFTTTLNVTNHTSLPSKQTTEGNQVNQTGDGLWLTNCLRYSPNYVLFTLRFWYSSCS